jgi:uncharacterized repeat protein (TIGR01451 family)
MTLAGFEYGPDGRPVIAWREENNCGGKPRIFWTRQEQGQWHQAEFLSERRYNGGAPGDYAHQLALRPSDGNPFLIYADVGGSNEINTYVSDIGANPGGGVSTYIEGLVGPQRCASVNYSPAFGPSDQTPQWATGLSECNGLGPVRLNGVNINAAADNPRASLAIDAKGTRHVLWNSGSDVYYSRYPLNASLPGLTTPLFNDLNRFGGEVRIAVDGAGVLHAIVRGPDVSADWDLGAIVYLKSTDGGDTWSSPEYVDPHDDPAIQNPWNANSDLSFAIDADGVPSVTFWRWTSELWYARRDGRGGTWTQQRVTALPMANPVRANQLRFDPNGTPVIAYYDSASHMMRLARPVPPGDVVPIDVAVTATAAPSIVRAGATTTFTLTVTNKGVTNLDRVVLVNRLPAAANFISASPAQGADGQWTFALTSGASTTVTIIATAPIAEGATADVATVLVDAADDHPEDNAAAAVLRVQPDHCFVPDGQPACGGFTPSDGTDIAVVVEATPATVAPGGFATFLIGVTNTGSVDLSDVNVDNVLGGGAAFVDAAPNPQSAIGAGQHFNIGSLAKGEQKWIVVRAMAPLVPGTISSRAHHLIDGDQNTLNDESRAVVQVVPDMCFVPPASLVGRWRADGDVSDATGGAVGSMVGDASFAVGRAGQAFSIHGNGSYVEVPDAPQLKPAQFTIAAWTLAPSFAQGGFDTVIAKGASGQDGNFGGDLDSYWLGFSNGRPTLYTQHQNGTGITQGPTPLSPMQWYHLAATFDGTTARVYVNGVEVAQNVIGSPIQYDSHPVPLVFGDDWQYGYASGDADYRGLIDEVAIHNRALSADEMRAMVEGSTDPACLEVVPDPGAPIRNGIPEARSQFSGVGMILSSATHGACTATMISPFIVLTAAQCLIDSSPEPVFEFSLGEGRTARLIDIRRHPLAFTVDGFNQAFDVALASLDRADVASWADVVPATLRAEPPTPIVEATAVGFGATNDGGRRTSGTLLLSDYAPFMGPDGVVHLQALLVTDPGSANQMFCAPGTGGPLFFEDQIVGVAAFRNVATCADDGPGFYINTSRVADWIHATTSELTNHPPLPDPVDVTTPNDVAITIVVTATDLEGDAVTATLMGNGAVGGHVEQTGPMSFFFTPDPTFVGHAFFFYRVADQYASSETVAANIQVTPPTTVRIDVVERITVTDSVVVTPAVMIDVAEAIHVIDTVVPTPAVMITVSEQVHVADTIVTGVVNTPAGINVMAPANGPVNATSAVSVTFPTVTQPGNTTFITQQGAFPPPDGFRYGKPPVTFDISTTAIYTAPLRVCITFGSTVFMSPAAARLFHYENGHWVDRTVSVDTTNRIICASVGSLSPFAIAEPEDLEGRMDGDGEVEAGGREYRVGFHIAERHIGDERGRLELTVVTPKSGKQKEARDEFASTAIDAINFWDDPAFSSGRWNRPRPEADSAVFAGVGEWNGASGYSFEARASDEGEPGRGRDHFTITIRDNHGIVVASVDGVLSNGNIQSERLKKEHWR